MSTTGFSTQEIMDFINTHFSGMGEKFVIESSSTDHITLIYSITARSLRPGGTVSGPTLMLIADCALYMLILTRQKSAVSAVTTNLSFNFFRKASGQHNIKAVCKLLKIGKKLATGEVLMYSEQSDELVAHAIGTFAL